MLSSLEELGQASRAELARATGLSATAVTSLTAELLAEGAVVERRDTARPPASTAVQVSALAMPGLEIEIEAYAICAD